MLRWLLLAFVCVSSMACASTAEETCMNSPSQTLYLSDGRYECREAANACEEGFVQATSTEESCSAKTGCQYEPGRCYCPFYKGVQCICAMGPPPTCGAVAQHGDVREEPNLQAWDEPGKAWLGMEAFWQAYTQRNGGLTWERSAEYPEYSKVKEHDTFLVQLPQGVCLMEFFHTRWRRANDVRRWNPAFNEYGGCPYVFD